MPDVRRENRLQHTVETLDIRVVDVSGSPTGLEEKERVGIQGGGVEIGRVLGGHTSHRVGVRAVLFTPLLRVEVLDIADRHRLNEGAFRWRRVLSGERQRLLNGGVRTWCLIYPHRAVQIRPPGPGFAPVADRALRVVLLCFPERPCGVDLRERIHQLETLVEILLCLRAG